MEKRVESNPKEEGKELRGITAERLLMEKRVESNPKRKEKSFVGLLQSGWRGRNVWKVIPRREKRAPWDYCGAAAEGVMKKK